MIKMYTNTRECTMRRGLILVLLLVLSLGSLAAESFRFKYVKDEKYRLLTEVNEEVYYNGRLHHLANIVNKAAIETLMVRDGAGLLSAQFSTSEFIDGVALLREQQYQTLLWRDAQGSYDIGEAYYMPVVREVPFFPEEDISPGTSWNAPGQEAHDFRTLGIAEPVRFPINVRYTYIGKERKDDRELDLISIQYEVFHRFQGLYSSEGIVPVRVTGNSKQLYYWDGERGKPHSYEEQFDFIFTFSNGEDVEYRGTSEGVLLESQDLDKERVAEDIARELEQRGVEDTTVVAEEEGVTLALQNIQFEANSAALRQSERIKLRQIGEILKNYPDRDILITGHTARVPGYTEKDHQRLSEQRALAVADFLLSLGTLRPIQVTTRGMGHREPLSDNDTEAGRRQNRRVEITILEN
jgi:outer membrane protein OmpA-like peptidoglycan-associated protein